MLLFNLCSTRKLYLAPEGQGNLPNNVLLCCQTVKTEKAKLFFTVWATQLLLGCPTSLQGREKHGCSLISAGLQQEKMLVFAEIWVSHTWFHLFSYWYPLKCPMNHCLLNHVWLPQQHPVYSICTLLTPLTGQCLHSTLLSSQWFSQTGPLNFLHQDQNLI